MKLSVISSIIEFFFFNWEFPFLGGGCRTFLKMVNIFTYTCPNHSGDGAIDSPDRFEHVFDPYYTLEVLEKIFELDISIVRP